MSENKEGDRGPMDEMLKETAPDSSFELQKGQFAMKETLPGQFVIGFTSEELAQQFVMNFWLARSESPAWGVNAKKNFESGKMQYRHEISFFGDRTTQPNRQDIHEMKDRGFSAVVLVQRNVGPLSEKGRQVLRQFGILKD